MTTSMNDNPITNHKRMIMYFLKKIIVFSFLFIALHAGAQKLPVNGITSFSWEMGFPSDEKYLDQESLSGWRVEWRKMIKSFSVGLAVSWNAFDQHFPTRTYNSADGVKAVTTDMIRQVYTVPMTVLGHYYFSTKGKVFQPYIGIGLGTQYTEFNTYFNIYQIQEKNWAFVARPELGALLSFGDSDLKGLIGVGYNYATNKYEEFDIDAVKHISVNVGLAIAY
jgi:hypothetical protein